MKQPLKILMKAGKKIIFWTSLILIFIFIIAPFVIRFTPLEFTSNNSLDSFEEFRFSGLPATILLTLFGTLKKKDPVETKATKIVWTICISLFSVFFLFITVFTGMCRWTTGKTLFENRNDKTVKVVLRDFGCGATDSGSPAYKICKIKNISPLFIWVTNVDTTKIDRQIWQRVERKH